jgi:hypothetical protein
MKQLEKKSFREIAEIMRGPYGNDRFKAHGNHILTDDMWGLTNGVYTPLAKLNLPVLYGGLELEDNHIPLDMPSVITVFSDNFFIGYHPGMSNEELPAPCEYEYWEAHPFRKICTEGTNASSESVLRQHIGKFLQLYAELEKNPERNQDKFNDGHLIRQCLSR